MALPQPTPLRVEFAPGANPDDDSTWAWEEITDYVRYADGIQIEAGRRDEGSQVDTTNCSLTLDNTDGRFSPRNPLGAYYGKLARNTPLRVRWELDRDAFGTDVTGGWGSTDQQGTAWSLFGAGGNLTLADWNVEDGEASQALPADALYRASWLDITTLDAEMSCTTRLPVADVTGNAVRPAGLMFRVQDFSNYYVCEVEVSFSEAVSAVITSVEGGQDFVVAQLDTGLTHDPDVPLKVRAQIVGQTLRMKVWAEGTDEPAAWNIEANDQTITAPGGVGFRTSAHSANTNRPLTAYYSDVSVLVDRFVGYVTEWPTRWDRSGNNSSAPIQATGILRRLQQGNKVIQSTLFRRITSAEAAEDLVAYWPLEDGKGTTFSGSPVAGVGPLKVVGFDFEADDDLPGSQALPTTGPGSQYDGSVPSRSATGDWHVEFVMRMETPTNTNNLIFIDTTGTAQRLAVRVTSGEIRLIGTGDDGSSIVNDVVSPAGVFGDWIRLAVFMSQSGGTVTWTVRWFPIGEDGFTFNGTFSGTAGAVKRVSLSKRGEGATTVAFGHLSVWSESNVPWYSDADTGLNGEFAGERMLELSADQGVPFRLVGDEFDTTSMGPQLSSTYLQLMRDCETADAGTLHELAGGLAYVTRSQRYNQPVSLALDVDDGDVAAAPEPTDDDQQLRNDFTATRPRGGTVRFVDQDSVDQLGTYEDSAEANVQLDSQLRDFAAWQVHLGTVDEMRWPRISLQLARNPDLIAPWLALRIGGRVTVDHDIDQIPGVNIDLLVDGWTETLNLFTWDVELNCAPASPWDVAIIGDDDLGRLDTDGSEVDQDVTATGTQLMVRTTTSGSPTWTTDSDEFSFDVKVGGEIVTVTDVADAFSDTFTRSVTNGWGTADSGQTWSTSGGAASDYLTTSGVGRVVHTNVGTRRFTYTDDDFADLELVGQITSPPLATGGGITAGFVARFTDTGNFYSFQFLYNTNGTARADIVRRVGGTFLTIATSGSTMGYPSGFRKWIKLRCSGTNLMMRVWDDGDPEPTEWTVTATDDNLTSGAIGTHSVLLNGNTSGTTNIHHDNVQVISPQVFTIIRSVNGIAKAHQAGTDVRLAHPSILAR